MSPARKQSKAKPAAPKPTRRGKTPAPRSRQKRLLSGDPSPRSRALDHLAAFVGGVEALVPRVKKLFDDTSSAPPDNANKQTRFANKIDSLATDAESVLRSLDAAYAEAEGLPGVQRCAPGDALAKRLLTGLKVASVGEQFQGHVEELRQLATKARQPMSPEESRELWERFARLVEGLGGILDLAQNVQRLIAKHRERLAGLRSEKDLRHYVMSGLRTTSTPDLKRLRSSIDESFTALADVEKAVRDLCRGMAKLVSRQRNFTRAAMQAEWSIIQQQDVVHLALREFEDHARTFIEAIKGSRAYMDVVDDGESSVFSDLPKAVSALVVELRTRVGVVAIWIEAVGKRQAAAFAIPGHLMEGVWRIAGSLGDARAHLDRFLAANPGGTDGSGVVGTVEAAPAEGELFVGLGDKERRVLEALVRASEHGEPGITINDLMAATGLAYTAVRRILTQRLGLGVVTQAKQARRGGPRAGGSSSPPDLFSVPEATRAAYRRWVDAARNTP